MKLFWRIFLTFLVTTILMDGFIVFLNEYLPLRFINQKRQPFQPEAAVNLSREAINSYEVQGRGAFLSTIHKRLATAGPVYLFDGDGQLLEKEGSSRKAYLLAARRVTNSGHAEFFRLDLRDLFVCPVQSASGRRYAVVLTVFEPVRRFQRPRYWLNLAFALLPAALVCALLSLYITQPITGLQKTTQRIAEGDLQARSSPSLSARTDEFGKLARDFDVMSTRIQSLITAQRRFVADVSHELGAPLTRLHLALTLLKRQSSDTNRELARIERETTNLSELVQQLLLLASLEPGQLPIESLSPVALQNFSEEVIHDASFEASKRGCRIVGRQDNVTAAVYPHLLRRALDNVLRNAIRYAPEGSEIVFNCQVTEDGQHVSLEILDAGPGVPESMLSDIFRPFFRTSPGRERSSGGTGLGLAIASDAIHLHHGTITAQNRSGGGLHVIMTLPLNPPDAHHESSFTSEDES